MTHIAFSGNITAPIELRFTTSGKAVGSVTVAVNRKKGDTEETDFHRVTLWESLAENSVELDKGTRVVVIGRLVSREYETKAGEKRTGWEVTADSFGPDLRFASVKITRAPRAGSPAVSSESQDDWAQPGGEEIAF